MKFRIKELTDELILKRVKMNKIADYSSSIFVYLLTLYLACCYYIPNNNILTLILFGIVLYSICTMLHTILFKYDNVNLELEALKENKIVGVTQKNSGVVLELLDGTKLKSVLLRQVIKSKYNTENYIDVENGSVYIKD